MKNKEKEKKFDVLKWLREVRDKKYEEWKKDPKGFDRRLMNYPPKEKAS